MVKVELRKLKMSDLSKMAKLYANDNVLKNLNSPLRAKDFTLDIERSWLLKVVASYKKKKPESFNLAIIANGEYVGNIAAHHIDYENEKTEIGYWIGEPYWGRGIVAEAIKQFVKIIFKKFNLVRIEAKPYLRNKASQRVLVKAGFKHEGTSRKSIKKGNKFIDDTMYARVR